jgi:hypothetical protein
MMDTVQKASILAVRVANYEPHYELWDASISNPCCLLQLSSAKPDFSYLTEILSPSINGVIKVEAYVRTISAYG